MSGFSFSGLRIRLLSLVLLALIPAFGLIIYTAWEQRQTAAEEAKEKSLKVARSAVDAQRLWISDTRQLLGALARQTEMIYMQPAACSRALADQLRQHRGYNNLGLIDLDGALRCSAVRYEGVINLRDRIYFQKVIETRDFTLGHYQIGRVTGKATIVFGHPLFDRSGSLRGVLFASLDLDWLNRIVAQSQLFNGSVLMVVDQKGTIFAHSGAAERWVGKSVPHAPIVEAVLSGQREGTVEAAGVDGVERLYAFSSLPVSTDRAYIAVGIPTRVAYAGVHRVFRRNVVFLAVVALLTIVAAWFGGDLFVLRQVNALLAATRRFACGELYGRTRFAYAAGELAQLAQSFDAMGVALHAREEELRRSKEEAQHHLERIRALHEINLAINSTLDLRNVADILLEKAERCFPYPTAAAIWLVSMASGELEPLACRNLDESAWKADHGSSGLELTRWVAETKNHLAVEDFAADPRTNNAPFFRRHNLASYLGVPLVAKGELLGVISIYSKELRRFTEAEIEFLKTLGEQAAIAINNSRIFEDTKSRVVESDTANKLKGEFLSVMSHELRTPLAVAMGYTGMLKEGVLGEINARQEEALNKVLRRGHDQLYMINSILYAASIEARAVKVERERINLSDLLDELRSTYDVIVEKDISMSWDYARDLPLIKTDARKLKHILENLINNAIKYTEKGTIAVSARCQPEAKTVQFAVTDTGVGISRDFLPIVFDIFRQVDGSATRPQGGVGLGLYIVKKFTELLGGKVKVESEFGKGSKFSITIPCEALEQAMPDSLPESVNRAA